MASRDKHELNSGTPAGKDNTSQKHKKSTSKVRLFSHLNIKVPVPKELTMILPSLNVESEEVSNNGSDVNNATLSVEPSLTTEVLDSHGQINSETSESNQNSSNSVTNAIEPDDRNIAHTTVSLTASHHLSNKLHPIVHRIVSHTPSTEVPNMPSINPSNPSVQHHSQTPTPQIPVNYINETIQGKYGSLHVNADGKYTFTLDPTSPNFILLQKQEVGTDTFTLHLSNGTKVLVQIPVYGHQDSPTVSGDLQGHVTEDQNVDGNGLITTSGKIDVIDPDHDQSSVQPEVITGKYGTLSINAQGYWQYQVNNSQSNVQALTTQTELHESFVIHTKDGTPQVLNMSIGGSDDNASITGGLGSVVEDQTTSVNGQLMITDPDANQDHFVAEQLTGAYGHLDFNQSGTWHYILDNTKSEVQHLNASEHHKDVFTIHSADGTSHQIEIDIGGTNDAPTLTAQTHSVIEDGKALSGQMVGHDIDHGAQLTYSIAQPVDGLTFNPDGSYTFDPSHANYQHLASGQQQTLAIPVTVTDEHGASSTQPLTIHLTGSGDNAVITGVDTGSVTEDLHPHAPVQGIYSYKLEARGTLSAVDPDAGESGFEFKTIVHAATHPEWAPYTSKLGGQLEIDPKGNWVYYVDNRKPEIQHLGQGESLTDTVTVHSKDGTTHDIVITIHGTNDTPTLTAQTHSVIEDGKALSGQMVGHDIDHGAQLTYSIAQPVDGLTFNPDGSYTFDPSHASYQHLASGQQQTLAIPVTVTDEHGASSTQPLTIHLTGSGDNAVITGVDTGSVTEDLHPHAPVQGIYSYKLEARGTLNAVDPDAGESGFEFKTIVHAATHPEWAPYTSKLGGQLEIDPKGNWVYYVDNRKPEIQHLGQGESLTDTVTVHSKDGTTHDIVITIHGTNDAPIISSDVHLNSGREDTVQTLTTTQLLAHASDIDHNDTGSLFVTNLVADHGSVHDNQDGTFTFTPDKDYNGLVHFSYDVKDAHGGTTHASATTTLAAVGDAATFSGDDIGDVTEDKHVQGDGAHSIYTTGVLNVSDPDANQDHFMATRHAHALNDPYGGLLTIGKAGDWAYSVPNGNVQHLAQGETAQVQYEVQSAGGDKHIITVNIHGTNDAPTLTAQTHSVIEDGKALSGQMVGHDIDHGAQLTYSIAQPVDGLTFNPDGSYTFDPSHASYQHLASGQQQTLAIPVTVTDEHGASSTQPLTIHLTGSGDNAVITGVDTGSVIEDLHPHAPVQGIYSYKLEARGTLSAVDPDAGESGFEFKTIVHAATHPEWAPYTSKLGGQLEIDPKGNWVYYVDNRKPEIQHLGQGESLTDTVTVHSKDGTTHDIVITIHGTNDTPTLTAQTHSVIEDGKALSGQMVGHDIDHGAQLTYSIAQPVDGLTFNPDGSYTFDPSHANYQHLASGQQQTLAIPVTITDEHGASSTQPLTIHLAGSGDNAVITGVDTGSVTEDLHPHAPVQGIYSYKLEARGTLSAVDPDAGESGFEFKTLVHAATHPEWAPYTSKLGGQLEIDPKGNWVYYVDNRKPEIQHLGQGESLTDTVTVHSKDGTTHDIVITIHGTNDAPIISSDVHLNSGREDTVQTLTTTQLLAHASDIDHNDTGSLFVTNLVADHGSVHDNQDGTFTFTPDKDYNGLVHFSYDVKDAHGGTTPAKAQLTLTPSNDPSTLAPNLAATSVTEDHTQTNTGHTLWSGWTNLDIKDPDGQQDAKVVEVEVNGVRHQVPAHFALTLPAIHGYFRLTHSTDGHDKWSYTADNLDPNIQALKTGEHLQDTITLITADGSRIPITATINGEDDHVVIDSPAATVAPLGTAIEDTQSRISGTLQAHDADHGDTVSYQLSGGQTSHSGQFGTLHVDSTGVWHYDLDHARADHLMSGETKAEGFDIVATSSDGSTATQHIEVIVQGTNDIPVVSEVKQTGLALGHHDIKEDDHSYSQGQIIITDVDHGDQHSVTIDSQHSPSYGSVSYDSHTKTWTYTLDNHNAKIDALNDGDELKDTFSLLVDDGHGGIVSKQIEMTIHGHSDAPPTPTLVAPAQITGSAGHQDLHASLGIPPLTPQAVPQLQSGWGILTGSGHVVSSLQGQFGTLHVDPLTGELHYDYQNSSGVIKTHTGGNSGAGTDETDSFVLTLAGTQNSQVSVHLHLHSQSVHGNSGHHIDMTTLTGIDVSPLAPPPPPPPVSQSDEAIEQPTTFTEDVTLTLDDSISLNNMGAHDNSGDTHHGAAAYLSALGLKPVSDTSHTSSQTSLPDDIDIVLAEEHHLDLQLDANSNDSAHSLHDHINHEDEKHQDLISPDEHHDQADPSNFIDPY